jgi:CheY-like chemotaxis protein
MHTIELSLLSSSKYPPSNVVKGDACKPVIIQKKSCILVVEDDAITQRLLTLLLEHLGCKVIIAETGEAVLKQSLEHVDLILMDLGLPDMTGAEITKILRKRDVKIPIIAHTAHTISMIERDCLAAGMNAASQKLSSIDELKQLLERWLSQSH